MHSADPTPRAGLTVLGEPGTRPVVGKILCAGKNYQEHVRALGDPAPEGRPVFFAKPPSALVGPGEGPWLPPGCASLHPEAELVMVIGRRCRDVPEDRALDHLLGWAAGLDMTDRGWQAEAKQKGWPWEWAKGYDGSAVLGEVVPVERVPSWEELRVRLRVDGELCQEADPRRMTHSPARLLALISERITLEPGDLVFTGAPAGTAPVEAGAELELTLSDLTLTRVRVTTSRDARP